MITRLLTVLVVLSAAGPAFAHSDLTVSIDAPPGAFVYDMERYEVTVSNVGNRNARNVELVVELPETNTSPTVHVMGDLGAMSSDCAQSGNTLVCSLGRIRKNRSETVFFDIALPQNDGPLEFVATASTTSRENTTANNEDSHIASLSNPPLLVSAPNGVQNWHCTGQGLTSFFECELYPSSISGHDILLEANGTITFAPGVTGYTGVWSQSGTGHLTFQYYAGNILRADFEGYAVDADCFEGVTEFVGTPYVAPYRVCLK